MIKTYTYVFAVTAAGVAVGCNVAMAASLPSPTIYWADIFDKTINSAVPSGAPQTLVTTSLQPYGISVDSVNKKLYWTFSEEGFPSSSRKIERANLDGTQIETVLTGFDGEGVTALDIDHVQERIYWTDRQQFSVASLLSVGFDGTGVTELVVDNDFGSAGGVSLDLQHERVYFSFTGTQEIYSANLDGSDLQTLATGINAYALAVDPVREKLYWTETFSGSPQHYVRIMRSDLDGSSVEEVYKEFSNSFGIFGLAIDLVHEKLYWSDFGTLNDGDFDGRIMRASLGGTGVETVVTGLHGPWAIDLVSVPEPASGSLLISALAVCFAAITRRRSGIA
jgi:hypothetical protein